jgi:hypothetical protein
MNICPKCGGQFQEPGIFCSVCAPQTWTTWQQQPPYPQPPPSYPPPYSQSPPSYSPQQQPAYQPGLARPHNVAARGVAQIFGVHPAIAILTIAVDVMLFGSDGVMVALAGPTAGISLALALIISCSAGGILGTIAYMAQKKWYGDDNQSALIKALILAFLTAIPTSIPNLLFVPFGLLGFFRKKPQR